MAAKVARHIREHRPRVTFAALTGIDKASHSMGHDSPAVHEAMRIVDATVAEIRRDAERSRTLGLDAPVDRRAITDTRRSRAHDDLATLLRSLGPSTRSRIRGRSRAGAMRR